MTKHVYSTLSASVNYSAWDKSDGVNTIARSVTVHGGATIARPGTGPRFHTPNGVRTEVTDDDARFLADHWLFKQHRERGHVQILDRPKDADKVAEKMEPDEGSAPKTPEDVKEAAEAAAKQSGLKPDETLQVAVGNGGGSSKKGK